MQLVRWLHPEWHPRRWSNERLRQIGTRLAGDVINVSAWEDRDKEGGTYAEYFPDKTTYAISNYGGTKGESHRADEIRLDLEKPVPHELRRAFDVVVNHTTLEHVYDCHAALDALCELSRDVVVVVVPFMQIEHWEPTVFGDYWRFTALGLQRHFEERELTPLYLASNHNPVFPIYYICVASREPLRWEDAFNFPDNLLSVPLLEDVAFRPVAPGWELMK